MRLVDLSPRWIHADIFAFLCPHCWQTLLTCKRVVMSRREQRELCERLFGEDDWNELVILSEVQCAWTMAGDSFDTMTVTPSLNAEKSGHWHGHITNGEIVGGAIREC